MFFEILFRWYRYYNKSMNMEVIKFCVQQIENIDSSFVFPCSETCLITEIQHGRTLLVQTQTNLSAGYKGHVSNHSLCLWPLSNLLHFSTKIGRFFDDCFMTICNNYCRVFFFVSFYHSTHFTRFYILKFNKAFQIFDNDFAAYPFFQFMYLINLHMFL